MKIDVGQIWKWATANRILAIAIVVVAFIFIGGAYGGISDWFQKRADIQELKKSVEDKKKENELERGIWKNALEAKDVEYSKVSSERDNLRKKIVGLQTAQAQPWHSPVTDNELLSRFKTLGY